MGGRGGATDLKPVLDRLSCVIRPHLHLRLAAARWGQRGHDDLWPAPAGRQIDVRHVVALPTGVACSPP